MDRKTRKAEPSEALKKTGGYTDTRSNKDKLMDLIPGRRTAERAKSSAKEFHGRRGVK